MNDHIRKKLSALASFTPLDILFPVFGLERNKWRDNPLVTYSSRRTGAMRFLLARLLELILIACFALLVANAFQFVLNKNVTLPVSSWQTMFMGSSYSSEFYPGSLIPRSEFFIEYRFVVLLNLGFVFLLIRYHLLVNNQSGILKSLAREKLDELLLTDLEGKDYFLHHFLIFCRRYTVLVGWAAVWAVFVGADMVAAGAVWLHPDLLLWVFMTLYMILLAWVGGVIQYVLEWFCFAGTRRRWWHVLPGLPVTAVLSFLIFFLGYDIWLDAFVIRDYFGRFVVMERDPVSPRFVNSAITLGLSLAIAYGLAFCAHASATTWLRRRLDSAMSCR